MPRHLHWSELTGGIIATALIVGLIVVIFLFARVGALHGKKVTLYVLTDDATGVLSGTEVWLGGKKAGLVKSVGFRPPSPDTLERLVIKTEVAFHGCWQWYFLFLARRRHMGDWHHIDNFGWAEILSRENDGGGSVFRSFSPSRLRFIGPDVGIAEHQANVWPVGQSHCRCLTAGMEKISASEGSLGAGFERRDHARGSCPNAAPRPSTNSGLPLRSA